MVRPSLRAGRMWGVLGCAVLLSLCVCSTSTAAVTAYFVVEGYAVVPAYSLGGNFNNGSVQAYVDPSQTNWIAWHNHTTPDLYGGQDVVGSVDWLGIDDYLYLTVTNPAGTTLRLRMDYNDGSGNPSGTQAVIYGSAAVAPDVKRKPAALLDEAGLFTSFFDSSGAGTYTFAFQFYDGAYGSYRNPDIYVLVDAEETGSETPAPGALLLAGLGVGCVGWLKRRRTAA